MKSLYDIIRRGVVTEKSSDEAAKAKGGGARYTFVVNPDANKIEIRQAVEKLFDLKNKVMTVKTMNYDGKWRRKGRKGGFRPAWKKAMVTVAAGSKIAEFDEG